jgi:hypothetical protein
LNLLRKLIDSFSSPNNNRSYSFIREYKELILNLVKNEKILRLILNDLTRYMNSSYNLRKALYDSSTDIMSLVYIILKKVFEGFYSHNDNLEARLNMINSILLQSTKGSIDYCFLTELWDLLVVYAIDENESNTLYKFLLASSDHKYYLW